MKWLKHMANASGNEDIVEIEAIFGLEGYARWWKLLEAVALQMDKTDRHAVAYPWSKWQEILKGKRKKLETFLEHLQKKTLISYEQNGEILEIKIPKLLRYRDEYSKKSGQAPDKLRTKDTETETELPSEVTEGEPTPYPPSGGEAPETTTEEDPVVLELPSKDGRAYPLRNSEVEEWRPLYPELDVDLEIRRARAWLVAKPQSQRKTYGGMPRFLLNWLNSARERLASRSAPLSPPPQEAAWPNLADLARAQRERREAEKRGTA